MTNLRAPRLGILCLLLVTAPAVAKKETEEVVALRPIVSSVGLKRLESNLTVLNGNIKDTESNLAACDKNKSVINNELRELDKLEKEQRALTASYEAYLTNATVQTAKNEERMAEIVKWETANKTRLEALKGERVAQDTLEKTAAAHQDRVNREKWKIDAESKTARVRTLLDSAKLNLKNIEAKRGPLREQAATWANKETDFKKVLTELSGRKDEFEKLVAAKKKDMPTDTEEK